MAFYYSYELLPLLLSFSELFHTEQFSVDRHSSHSGYLSAIHSQCHCQCPEVLTQLRLIEAQNHNVFREVFPSLQQTFGGRIVKIYAK